MNFFRKLLGGKTEPAKAAAPSVPTVPSVPTAIVAALTDGFGSGVIKATEHLYRIDANHTRAACLWGIVLMQEDRLDEAEGVFRDCISKYGEDGSRHELVRGTPPGAGWTARQY